MFLSTEPFIFTKLIIHIYFFIFFSHILNIIHITTIVVLLEVSFLKQNSTYRYNNESILFIRRWLTITRCFSDENILVYVLMFFLLRKVWSDISQIRIRSTNRTSSAVPATAHWRAAAIPIRSSQNNPWWGISLPTARPMAAGPARPMAADPARPMAAGWARPMAADLVVRRPMSPLQKYSRRSHQVRQFIFIYVMLLI